MAIGVIQPTDRFQSTIMPPENLIGGTTAYFQEFLKLAQKVMIIFSSASISDKLE